MFETELIKDEECGALILRLKGHLTLDEKPALDSLVTDAITSECDGLLLDVSELRFIDSAGLMFILSLFNKLGRSGQPMIAVTGDNEYARAKLDELGLMRIPRFEAFHTTQEGKDALKRGRD